MWIVICELTHDYIQSVLKRINKLCELERDLTNKKKLDQEEFGAKLKIH